MKTLDDWDKHLNKLERNFKQKYGLDDETYQKDLFPLFSAYYAGMIEATKEGLVTESQLMELAHNLANLEGEN